MNAEKIVSFLNSHEKEMISFTQQLVRIRSENGNETAVAKEIGRKLRKYKIKSRLVGDKKGRMNLVAAIGKKKGRTIILNGHTDTVKVTGAKKWKCPPFSGKIKGGKLFGRGSADMKSGVAAITFAAIALSKAELNGKVLLICSSDEEGGDHSGIKYLIGKGLRADACIIAEPHANRISVGNRGILRLQLATKGKTGHTGQGKASGINAVTKMAKVLLALQRTKFRFKKHKMFPKPRITPGTMIEGGAAVNIVPGECKALIDCRLSFGQTKQSTMADIKKVIKRLQRKDRELKVEIKINAYSPPGFTSPKEKIVKVCKTQVRKVYGFRPEIDIAGGATDGNWLGTKKIPYLIFGPNGKNYHSENEFVEVKTINKTAKAIALTAFKFLR